MAISARTARIGGATMVAAFLVMSAYVLPGLNAPKTKTVNAELTDDILASYVSKDTDADGLPDWQESLYGTDLNVADTDGDGISDGEAVRRGLLTPTTLASQLPSDPIGEEDIPGEAPAKGSITEQFSRALLETIIRESGGQPMAPEAQQALVASLMERYTSEAARSLNSSYTRVSVRTNASLSATSYAGSVERVLNTSIPDVPDSDMIELSRRIIQEDDEAAAARLNELGKQYLNASEQLLRTFAPPALAESHLRLIRGYEQAANAAIAVSDYKNDPLLTMGALAVFLPSRAEIMQAFDEVAQNMLMEGEPLPGAPGSEILDAVRQEQQQ